MTLHAFKDKEGDGYYQVEIEDGVDLPDWLLDKEEIELIPILESLPTIPQVVTNYQAKVALDSWQLFDELELYMYNPDTPKRLKLAWQSATFNRYSDMILSVAQVFELTDEQLDELFIIASKIE